MTSGAPFPQPAVPFGELARTVARLVDADAYPDDPPLVFIPGDRPIRRLGFALQAEPGMAAWADGERLDAVFLHRPWGAGNAGLGGGVGVLASHQGFDARMTMGAHPRLARAMRMRDLQPLGSDPRQPLGMVGSVTEMDAGLVVARITGILGGVEEVVAKGAARLRRIAIVNAMTDGLVRQAAGQGAQLYLTGQVRHPARRALEETGMAAIGIGHRRSEEYALRTLGALLAEAFPGLHPAFFHADGADPA